MSSSFSSSNSNGRESLVNISVERLNLVHPVAPFVLNGVKEVVINTSIFGELKLGASSSKVSIKISLRFIKAGSERPDHSKCKETIVHLLDSIKNIVTACSLCLKFTEELCRLLINSHLSHLVVNNNGKRFNPGNFYHRLTDIKLHSHLIEERVVDVVRLSELELSISSFVFSLGSLLLELG